MRAFLVSVLLGLSAIALQAEQGVHNPVHGYFTEAPQDRFAKLRADLRQGTRRLETEQGDLPFLQSLLDALEVPVSSQMLVYSVTSLQKALISPRRPRALYFNDDTYVGFVPDGRIEVISMDPKLGSIFYIFDRLTPGGLPRIARSEECMNCHAPSYLGSIPALALESVVPGLTGGGERAFRRERTGHDVPLEERFGGWHVTGVSAGFPHHWGNLIIERHHGEAHEIANPPGTLFDLSRYLRPTSDVLPQLLQEHQVGFVNRALQAAYAAREAAPGMANLPALAAPLVRYLFFADEVPLTPGSVTGQPDFRSDFQRPRVSARDGKSLRDFDLSTRLFRYRCSYMIYSPVFTGLPAELKAEVLKQMRAALGPGSAEFAYLPAEEKGVIRRILEETLAGFGQG